MWLNRQSGELYIIRFKFNKKSVIKNLINPGENKKKLPLIRKP